MPEVSKAKLFLRRFWWLILIFFVFCGFMTIYAFNNSTPPTPAKNEKSQTLSHPSKNDCPDKIIYFSDNTKASSTNGIQTIITDAELTALFTKCPGIAKESSISTTAAQQLTSTSTTQASSQISNGRTPTPTTTAKATPTPTQTTDTLSLITPYVNETDIDWVPEAWSITDITHYWGFKHPGIDFRVLHNIPVQAAAAGTVENFAVAKESGQMGWHAGFCIKHNTTFSVCYNLESFGSTDEIGQAVASNMSIKNGDTVTQGQVIGNLVFGGDGAHIDFGVGAFGTRPCPEPFLTADAKASIMRLIHKTQPDWPMCADN